MIWLLFVLLVACATGKPQSSLSSSLHRPHHLRGLSQQQQGYNIPVPSIPLNSDFSVYGGQGSLNNFNRQSQFQNSLIHPSNLLGSYGQHPLHGSYIKNVGFSSHGNPLGNVDLSSFGINGALGNSGLSSLGGGSFSNIGLGSNGNLYSSNLGYNGLGLNPYGNGGLGNTGGIYNSLGQGLNPYGINGLGSTGGIYNNLGLGLNPYGNSHLGSIGNFGRPLGNQGLTSTGNGQLNYQNLLGNTGTTSIGSRLRSLGGSLRNVGGLSGRFNNFDTDLHGRSALIDSLNLDNNRFGYPLRPQRLSGFSSNNDLSLLRGRFADDDNPDNNYDNDYAYLGQGRRITSSLSRNASRRLKGKTLRRVRSQSDEAVPTSQKSEATINNTG